ncbi:MAG: hypothetical protein OXC62_07665 [Aestuariivita sp.]|nr:hypothetical protein [Aestuariivita sp.]
MNAIIVAASKMGNSNFKQLEACELAPNHKDKSRMMALLIKKVNDNVLQYPTVQ